MAKRKTIAELEKENAELQEKVKSNDQASIAKAAKESEGGTKESAKPKGDPEREQRQIKTQAQDLRAGWVPQKKAGERELPKMWCPPGATHPIKWDQWVDIDQKTWTNAQKEPYRVLPPYKNFKII
jgi:hypothetical protein